MSKTVRNLLVGILVSVAASGILWGAVTWNDANAYDSELEQAIAPLSGAVKDNTKAQKYTSLNLRLLTLGQQLDRSMRRKAENPNGWTDADKRQLESDIAKYKNLEQQIWDASS